MKRKTRKLLSIFLAVVLVAGLLPIGQPAYAEGDEIAAIGENTYESLQLAVDNAVDGDTVTLLADTAEIVTVADKDITLDLKTYTLSGGGSGATLLAGSVLTVSGGTVTITGGVISGANAEQRGGGLYITDAATVTVSGCTIKDNTCSSSAESTPVCGGGVYADENCKLTLNNCTVSGNTCSASGNYSSAYGGGIYLADKAQAIFSSCVITGNSCSTSGQSYATYDRYAHAYGGGVSAPSGAALTFNNCQITTNNCTTGWYNNYAYGGGLYAGDSTSASLSGCTVSENNSKSRSRSYSAGLCGMGGSELTLTNCDISKNVAEASSYSSVYGAGVYTEGVFTMEGGNVEKNAAAGSGNLSDPSSDAGGITGYYGCKVTVKDVSFADNLPHSIGMNYDGTSDRTLNISGCSFTSDNKYYQIYLQGYLEGSIKDCTLNNSAAALWCGGGGGKSFNLSVEGTKICGNTIDNESPLIYLTNKANVNFKECDISSNKLTEDSNKNGVLFVSSESVAVMEDCTVTGNENVGDYTININGRRCSLTLTDTEISGNHAACVGGILVYGESTLTINNSVIKNNVGDGITTYNNYGSEGTAGGISLAYGSKLVLNSGAIYDNELTNSISDEMKPNDLFIQRYKWPSGTINGTTMTSSIDAKEMTDGDVDFSQMVWKDSNSSEPEDRPAETLDNEHRYYTVVKNYNGDVAQVGDVKFTTVQAAIDAAGDGDTVYLISNESNIDTSPLTVNKDITIDFNGRNLRLSRLSSGNTVLTVKNGGSLTLSNTTSDKYKGGGTTRGSLAIEPGGSLTVEDAMTISGIKHNGSSLLLNAIPTAPMAVTLGPGKLIELGDAWSAADADLTDVAVNVTLDETSLTALNAAGSAVVVKNAGQALIPVFSFKNAPNTAKKDIVALDGTNHLVLRTVNAVFLSSYGSDGNDGKTPTTPVATFAKAKALLAADANLEGIYICGTVNVSGAETWSFEGDDRPVMRYKGFTGQLINVKSGGNLTLENIVIDGQKDYLDTAARSLVYVERGGTLNIEDGAELCNNRIVKNNEAAGVVCGGAVESYGTLNMSGGRIHGNIAGMGGGVYQSGGVFTMTGGVIENNRTQETSSVLSSWLCGGGVMLAYGAQMKMSGPAIIRNNRAFAEGGGISLGNRSSTYSSGGIKLTIYADSNGAAPLIKGNSAVNGGGIYIQCYTKAYISAGDILENHATAATAFPRGGGIYVNGEHITNNYISGELYLTNVEIAYNESSYGDSAYGGIMTCSTSETFIRDIDGAAIHDNIDNSSYGDSQVALTNADATLFGFNMRNDSYVSEFMPGGGRYDWHRPNGEVIGRDLLVNVNEPISLYSDLTASSPDMAAAIAKCKVHINYNTSNSGGAGIGNNGLVYIGTGYLERVDVAVKKVWVGDDASSRPANIRLILKQDGVQYDEAVISSSEAEAGYTFKELPKYKLDNDGRELTDQPHTYTVEEDMSYVPSYQATVTRGADTSRTRTSEDPISPSTTVEVKNFTVTNTKYNTAVSEPVIKKTVSGRPAKPTDFSFTIRAISWPVSLTAAPMPDDAAGNELTVTIRGAGSKSLGRITFTLPGVYTYEVSENDGRATGYTYDKSVYTLIYTVETTATGLTVTSAIKKGGRTCSAIEFTNKYSGGDPVDPTPDPDPVPPDLNGDDHFAYIIGYPDGLVKPQANITRAEVATIFFRLLKDEVRDANWSSTNDFSDVRRGQWFNNAISTMANMDIVHGYPDGTFRPNDNITRAEFAAIAARFDKNANSTSANFSDISGHWAAIEIAKAAKNGWVKGYPDGTFKPDQIITRAEAMALVNRVLNRDPEKPEDLLDNMIKWPDNMDTRKWYYLDVQEATNSHTYERITKPTEKWVMLEQPRDWKALEW